MAAYIANTVLREALNINNLDGASELLVLLQVAVDAASETVDAFCQRTFTLADTASARVFAAPPTWSGVLIVDDIGSTTGLAVSVGADAVTEFTTGPRNALALGQPLTMLNVWPLAPWTDVTVTARWGWPAVPAAVKQATLRLAMRYFKGKDAPEGGSGWAEQAMAAWQRDDPMVRELLAPYRLVSVS